MKLRHFFISSASIFLACLAGLPTLTRAAEVTCPTTLECKGDPQCKFVIPSGWIQYTHMIPLRGNLVSEPVYQVVLGSSLEKGVDARCFYKFRTTQTAIGYYVAAIARLDLNGKKTLEQGQGKWVKSMGDMSECNTPGECKLVLQ